MSRRCASTRRPYGTACWRRALPAVAILSLLGGPAAAAVDGAGDSADTANFAEFDHSLLPGAAQDALDLSRFERGNPVMPGNYNLDIYLNGVWAARSDVRFAAPSPNAGAVACVTPELMERLGLRPTLTDELKARLTQPAGCLTIGELIPDATMTLDLAELRLDTSVPQAYLGQAPRGYVSPEYWDAGVPAALLNYNLTAYHSASGGLHQTTAYLGLSAGLNIGAWRLRQSGTLSWQSAIAGNGSRRRWETIASYVQRDLPSLHAQLTVGDSYTDGQVFDSIRLRGVQLGTDDRMLPDSIRGYAPVVRGVARTNALVTISQNGNQLYQTTVPPGPFVIADLYPTGYGGDLEVLVTEADGRASRFAVPYASVAQLLRPGATRFDLAAGWLRDTSLHDPPAAAQATVQHGFNNLTTGYAGVQGAQGYAAVLLGSAFNTRAGAFAADLTVARARIPGLASSTGRSLRLSYSKILSTGTSLTVAAYRYSTRSYLSLADAAIARDYARQGRDAFTSYVPPSAGLSDLDLLSPAQRAALSGRTLTPDLAPVGLQRQKSRFSLTMNQQLGDRAGALYANASASDYWDRSGTDTQFQFGYSNALHGIGYNLTATRVRNGLGRSDTQYMLSINVPLGESAHAPVFSANFAHSDAGTQEQAMLNGAAGTDNQFTYGATASHSSAGTGEAFGLNGGYRGPFAVLNASVGRGSGYSQSSFGMSGAVAVHAGGITLGQPTGDTVGLVHAPGARGARLMNAPGARIDGAGYALVPYLVPYNLNTVELDPKGLPLDVQLEATGARTAPHAGAVVRLEFKTQSGRAVIAQVLREDGSPLPFGTEIRTGQGTPLGVTGQAGRALLRGLAPGQRLLARWRDADGAEQSCRFDYSAAATAKGTPLRHVVTFVCKSSL